jgi:hypothetical protein
MQEPSRKRRPGFAFWIVVALVLFPPLYVFSIGPYAFLMGKGVLSQENFFVIYAPLMPVRPYIPKWFGEAEDRYVTWCFERGKEQDKRTIYERAGVAPP